MIDPAELVIRVLNNKAQFDEETKCWFLTGLEQYVSQDGEKLRSLDYFLGLSAGAGKSWAVTKIKLMQRDECLKRAGRFIMKRDRIAVTPAASKLLEAINRFSCTKWHRIKSGSISPVGPIEQALTGAFSTGAKMPRNNRTLEELLREELPK